MMWCLGVSESLFPVLPLSLPSWQRKQNMEREKIAAGPQCTSGLNTFSKQTLRKASIERPFRRSISFFDCFMFLSFILSLVEMKWKFWRFKAIWEYSKVSFSVCLWHLDGKTTKLELSWDSDRIYMPAFVRMSKFGKTYYNKMHIWR